MPRRKRQIIQRLNRRIAPEGTISSEVRANLERARYVGNPKHKLRPGDYGLDPPVSPRPSASVCDELGPISMREAGGLFRAGIRREMVSNPLANGFPKFVWAVDESGEAYEAIGDGLTYHGYRLNRDAPNREAVIAEWQRRSGQG